MHNISSIKKLFVGIVIMLTNSNIHAQNLFLTGEKEFSFEDEKGVFFTSYQKSDFPNLPKSIYLEKLLPSPGNQLPLGACWAFATTYAMRSFLDNNNKIENYFLKADGQPDYTKIYSPEFSYQVQKGNICNKDAGQYSYQMLDKILKIMGAVTYEDFPYSGKCNNQPSTILKNKALKNIKKGYTIEVVKDVFSMKKILSTKQPLIIAMLIDDFFASNQMKAIPENNFSPKWDTFHTRHTNHAMVAVGYNDTINAFKVLNSWGPDWGNKGYCWIGYNIINSSLGYACYPKLDDITNKNLVIAKAEESSNKLTISGDQELKSWFKEGYYRRFNNLRFGLSSIDTKTKSVIVNIRDNTGKYISTFSIDAKSSKYFYINGIRYRFSLNSIGKSRLSNMFSPPAFFSISKVNS